MKSYVIPSPNTPILRPPAILSDFIYPTATFTPPTPTLDGYTAIHPESEHLESEPLDPSIDHDSEPLAFNPSPSPDHDSPPSSPPPPLPTSKPNPSLPPLPPPLPATPTPPSKAKKSPLAILVFLLLVVLVSLAAAFCAYFLKYLIAFWEWGVLGAFAAPKPVPVREEPAVTTLVGTGVTAVLALATRTIAAVTATATVTVGVAAIGTAVGGA
ncbi:hypothetical protein MMC34_007193 [Xylographa carneopallida]|nr:hypothetical protein [Xylographa carneopallida]